MMIISSLEISLLLQISNCQQLQYALLLIIQRHVRGVKEKSCSGIKGNQQSHGSESSSPLLQGGSRGALNDVQFG